MSTRAPAAGCDRLECPDRQAVAAPELDPRDRRPRHASGGAQVHLAPAATATQGTDPASEPDGVHPLNVGSGAHPRLIGSGSSTRGAWAGDRLGAKREKGRRAMRRLIFGAVALVTGILAAGGLALRRRRGRRDDMLPLEPSPPLASTAAATTAPRRPPIRGDRPVPIPGLQPRPSASARRSRNVERGLARSRPVRQLRRPRRVAAQLARPPDTTDAATAGGTPPAVRQAAGTRPLEAGRELGGRVRHARPLLTDRSRLTRPRSPRRVRLDRARPRKGPGTPSRRGG